MKKKMFSFWHLIFFLSLRPHSLVEVVPAHGKGVEQINL